MASPLDCQLFHVGNIEGFFLNQFVRTVAGFA